ncbi:MAG TPA: autotransporter domain-containing protein [Syntrophorhabdaceae bacterium]|nr:autotransporter domain-containing protein [Syntrophorhabdaceae bacterium]
MIPRRYKGCVLLCLLLILPPFVALAESLTVPPDKTIAAGVNFTVGLADTCEINAGGTLTNNGNFLSYVIVTNNGVFDNSTDASVNIQDGFSNKAGATLTNNGYIWLNGGTLTNSGTFTNNSGAFYGSTQTTTNSAGGILTNSGRFYNRWMSNSGTITNESTGYLQCTDTITNEAGATLTNNGTIENGATLTNKAGATLTNNGNLTNSSPWAATLTNEGILNNNTGATLTNSRTFANNGTLNNQGVINVTSTGFLTQGAAATYTGSGSIGLAGTLTNNQGAGTFSVTTLDVSPTATGVLAGSGATAITTGNVSGTLNYTGTGSLSCTTLDLSGGTFNNNGSGTVSIAKATVAGGQTGTIGGTGTIELTTADVNGALTVSSVISGAGSLTKTGSGALTLSGANTYTGGTFVNGGSLIATNTLLGPFTIGASGVLKGTGTINGDVVNSGTLAPGNSIGTLTISGNYTHNAGAVYQVEVNAAGQSDKLIVTGTATLNGGTVSVLAESGNYNLSTTYTILTAGSVTGTFGNVTSNLAFLTPSLRYDPTTVYLVLTRNTMGFADVAATSNQYTVASALDRIAPVATGDMAGVMTTLFGFSAPSARGAFDQMGGLSHTALTGATFSSFSQYMGVMSGRMGGFISGGPRSSFANRPVMLASRTDTGSDAGNTLMAALSNAAGRTGTSRGLWAEGYGSLGQRRGNDISSRYDSDMAGFSAGFDRVVAPSLLVGASLGYSHTKVDMKDLSDSATVSSYQGSLYGIYKMNPFYVSGIAACGYNRYDTRRDIAFGTVSRRAKASYAGQTLGGYLEGGYRLTTSPVDIIPLASLTGIYLMRDGFTERDAGALSLSADSDHTSSLVGSLGMRLTKDYKISSSDTLTPELKVAWDHEFANGDYALDASFAGYPTSTFTVRGDRPNRDSLGAGFRLTWQTKEDICLHFTYDGSFSGDNTQHAGTLGIQYRW